AMLLNSKRTRHILSCFNLLECCKGRAAWPVMCAATCGRRLVLVPQKRRWLQTSSEQKDPQNPGIPDKTTKAESEPKAKGPPEDHLKASKKEEQEKIIEAEETDPLQDSSISIGERFKRTFKQYSHVLIPVHLVTSSVWFGSFYYASMKGVNVVPFLEYVGLPDSVLNILRNSQSGHAINAYAMYKIATPARYTVTLGGTSYMVRYLRKHGYLATPPPVKELLQDKMEETKELLSEKMEETRDKINEKMEETKDRISEKLQETFRKRKE
uniref:Family with sequence similarity 210 member A n=1 Tax=Latimeria chalumnae TaxID=7897 RepID=H3B375_LATCH